AHRKSNRDADKQNTYAHQQHESYDRPKFRQLQPSLVPTLHNCLRQSCCTALFALRARSNLRTSLLAFLLARRMPFSFFTPGNANTMANDRFGMDHSLPEGDNHHSAWQEFLSSEQKL